MPNFNLKNIPEHVHRKLKLRARRNHRSLNGELLAILTRTLEDEAAGDAGAEARARLAELRAVCAASLSLRDTSDAIDEGRA